MSFILKSTQEVPQKIAIRTESIRLSKTFLKKVYLAAQASLINLKRFERTSEISLKFLIEIFLSMKIMTNLDKPYTKDR